jgi:hypothetical protein
MLEVQAVKSKKLYDNNWDEIQKLRKLEGFKLAICGSRHLDPKVVEGIIRDHWKQACGYFKALPIAIVSGGAKGVDTAAANLAHELTGRLAFIMYADWISYGKSAGPSRNIDIALNVHGLMLIWDGKSRGSRHMKSCMEVREKPVFEIEVEVEIPRRKKR